MHNTNMSPLLAVLLISLPLSTPETICETLFPFHAGVRYMTTFSPLNIITSSSNIEQNQILTIQMKNVTSEMKFGGLIMMQARSTSPPYKILGRFTSSIDGLRLVSCDGVDNTAIYHVESSFKDDVELQWETPKDYFGEVLFKYKNARATIAQEHDEFLEGVKSVPVQIVQSPKKIASRLLSALVENYITSVKAEQRIGDLIYEGCGTTKTCFGSPSNCVQEQSCQAIVTAVAVGTRYHFELQSGAENVAYVALGLSRDDQMGEDSVIQCTQEGGIVRAYTSWNNPRPSLGNTRQDVPQNIISLLNSTYIDGTIYCKIVREPYTTILGNDFDLVNQNFHFLVAIGTNVSDTSLTRHDIARIASTQPVSIIRQSLPIYNGCGTDKTCFGLPINCVEQQSCEVIVTAVAIGTRYQFELQSAIDNIAYVALGLSRDAQMGEDSVIHCSPEEGIVRAYTSWNNPRPSLGNTREGVPQNIISLLDSSFIDGTIYCKLERDSLTTILGNEFDLINNNFHFVVAAGTTVTSTSITRHDLGRIASSEPVQIIRQRVDAPIYEGCGTTKTCFGLPENCVEDESCRAIATAAVVGDRYEFELQSGVDNIAYVSLGLSRDTEMGLDSVMECISESGIIRAYSSYNNPRPSIGNTRQGVPQNIISLLNSSYADGTIYCKLQRDASTTILGDEYDLVNENFHFLVAIGSSVTGSSVAIHDLGRIASSVPLQIGDRRIDDPIYEGCGENKTCFGLPNNCVEQESCQAIVTAVVLGGRYQFELQSGVVNVAYVALGLSRDAEMGLDSVMECIPEGGIIRAYTSWNIPRPSIGNTRQGVAQNIISLVNSSFVDGKIYCKLERERSTTILENEFNLANEDFHFLIGIGSSVTGSSVAIHNLGRIASEEPIMIVGNGQLAVKISIISIVVCFLGTVYTNYLQEM